VLYRSFIRPYFSVMVLFYFGKNCEKVYNIFELDQYRKEFGTMKKGITVLLL
jgi:hypothetical protein